MHAPENPPRSISVLTVITCMRCTQELLREKGRLQKYAPEAFRDASKEALKDSPRSRRAAEC
jgi:hypothetical protein